MGKAKTGMNWYKLGQMIKNWREAVREAEGYRDDPSDTTERRAILDKTKSHLNKVYIQHECLSGDPKDRNRAKKIRTYYRERYGKTMSKRATFGSRIIPLPRDYIPTDFGITEKEYKLLCKELEGEVIANTETLEKAKAKLLSRSYTDEEMERIYDFFEKVNRAMCKVLGIKEEDVMYSVLHADESNIHIHFCFSPSIYIEDKNAWAAYKNCPKKKDYPKELKKKLIGDTNREIAADECPVGCSQKRINAPYLHFFLPNLEKALKEQGIEAHLSNGRGHYMNVQQVPKEIRKATVIARNLEEVSKLRAEGYEKQIAMQEAQITDNEEAIRAQEAELVQNKEIIEAQEAELAQHKETIKDLKQEIKAAQTELKGLKKAIRTAKSILSDIGDRIGGLIQTGIAKIRRAKSRRDRDDAAKEAEEQLIRIKTDAEAVMNAFMPFDDDEVAGPEEEYDEERDDI